METSVSRKVSPSHDFKTIRKSGADKALGALWPWLRAIRRFSDESIDVSIIYRGDPSGDIQYFPLITQLARGTITDGTVKEFEGKILRSFPHATILPHAVSVAAFGEYGFLVADVAVAICYFLLVFALMRTMAVSSALSAFVGCFLALPIPVILNANLSLGPLSGSFPLIPGVWGTRIPRPFVSELFLLAVLGATLRLITSERATLRHWLWLALTFGLLLQGDIHAAMIFGLISPCVIFYVAKRDGIRPTLRNSLLAGIPFAAVITPFLLQRVLEHPDIPVRWGVFELNRMAGFEIYWRQLFKPTFAVVFSCFTGFWLRPGHQTAHDNNASGGAIARTWWFITILLFAAFFCLPVSIVILGKTVQPYHFIDRAERLCGYTVILLVVLWVDAMFQRWKSSRNFPVWERYVFPLTSYGATLTLILTFFGYKTFISDGPTRFADPVRREYYRHMVNTKPSYRDAFSAVVRHMKLNIPRNAVVASFDHQVFAWWMTFQDGHWFLVEPFVSSIPDQELETRLLLFCKTLGMSADDFIAFIQTSRGIQANNTGYVDTFWLGLAKYQASRLHTFAPLEDYTKEQQAAILKSANVWQTIIPKSELIRLRSKFEEITIDEPETRSLDVIVLSNSGPEKAWAPSENAWKLEFKNDGFRVFTRIEQSEHGLW
jgi:hypothetical protein